MTKNEDEKLVPKRAVKCLIENRIGVVAYQICNISDAIDKLPAVLPNSRQAGEIKSPEQIEKAIKKLEKEAEGYANCLQNKTITYKDACDGDADLLRWVLNQKQDTWSDKKLLDEEKIFGKS